MVVENMQSKKGTLEERVAKILEVASKKGATSAEVGASLTSGITSTIRMGETETVEFNNDQGFSLTVYVGTKKGTVTTSDLTDEAIDEAVGKACDIAKYTSEDEFAGLADKELMAWDFEPLDIYYPWDISPEQSIEMALECEAAGMGVSGKIVNSEGSSVSSHESLRVYGNSHGFIGCYPATRHSITCVLIGKEGESMQRDYWYDAARDGADMNSAVEVGKKAGERTIMRLGAHRIDTCKVPVLFAAEVAGSLFASFIGAVSGGNLYRKASFLLDSMGEQLFPEYIQVYEQPHLAKGLGSAPFDGEGVATREKHFIKDGVLSSYVLGSYSARKLGLQTTANAGGCNNLFISNSDTDFDGLLKEMGTGLMVTELMGQGVNMVTGDYSRGAAGYWVENGEISFPVQEITIAGNLRNMFQSIVKVGSDVDHRGNMHCGSVLLEEMAIAGN